MNNVLNEIKSANRIVIKVGTSTLTHDTGKLNIKRIESLVRVLSDLKNDDKEIILVTSGAISVGTAKLGLHGKPQNIQEKQAVAAIGQCELMNIYGKFFSEYNYTTAQILLTKDIVEDLHRKINAVNTFNTLLKLGVIPIVNENDSISIEEIEFGDNDTLSAVVGRIIGADLLIILSDIDGLYTMNPKIDKDAKLIPVVEEIDDYIRELAGGTGSDRGTGGMFTKIHAAEIATNVGMNVIIANGENPSILYDILEGKQIGTLFIKNGQKTVSISQS